LSRRRDSHVAQPVAAWLCRRHTESSLRLLPDSLGLSRADSVPILTRRLERRLKAAPKLADELAEILRRPISPAAGTPVSDGVPATTSRSTDVKKEPTLRGAAETKNKV
jgi:hypothetical protein